MKQVTHTHSAAQPRLPLTEAALCAWVGRANPGDPLVYYRGFLAYDLRPDSSCGTPVERQELHRVAARAWLLAEEGIVHLVQRRLGDANYEYLVVVRHRPRVAGGALDSVLEQAGMSDQRRSA